MKRALNIHCLVTVLIIVWVFLSAAPAIAADKVYVGLINDNYQLVTAGQIYEIADTPKGNDLAENHINAKVKVSGAVEERDDMKILTVNSYEILSE